LRTSNSLANANRKSTSPLIISLIIIPLLCLVILGLYFARKSLPCVVGGSDDSFNGMLGNASAEADGDWRMAVSKVLTSLETTLYQGDKMQVDGDEESDTFDIQVSQSARVSEPSRHPNREDDSSRRGKNHDENREVHGGDDVDDLDEYESDGIQSYLRKGQDEDYEHHGRSKPKRSKTDRRDSNDIKDDDDSGIHSSSISDYSTSYHQGGDGLCVGGCVANVSENGGIDALLGDIIPVSSETSETIYSADSESTDLMSQDVSIWSDPLSFMSGSTSYCLSPQSKSSVDQICSIFQFETPSLCDTTESQTCPRFDLYQFPRT